MLLLFSGAQELVSYGADHYHQRSENTSSLLERVLTRYGLTMSYTMKDFQRDYTKSHLKDLTLEERLEGLSAEERLEGLSADEIERILARLKKDTPEKKRKKKR